RGGAGESVGGIPRDRQREQLPASRPVLAGRRGAAARSVRDRGTLRSDRSARRRPASPVRARALAPSHLVSHSPMNEIDHKDTTITKARTVLIRNLRGLGLLRVSLFFVPS